MFEEFDLTEAVPTKLGYYLIHNTPRPNLNPPILIKIENKHQLKFYQERKGYFSKRLEIKEIKESK